MQPESFFIIRSGSHPKLDIPLNVRSVGRYFLDPSWSEKTRRKWFLQLFWTIKGEGEFLVGRGRQKVGEGDVFIYRPGDTHEFRAVTDEWHLCWITWDHPDSVRWIKSFGLTQRFQHRGRCPQWLFEEARDGLQEGLPEGERRAAHASHAILLEASIDAGQALMSNPTAVNARAFLDTHFADPSLTMDSLAEALNVHRTTCFRAFNSAYGLTPSLYLHNRRMQSALSLLHRSDLKIQEVAWRSGFSDPNYFSRAVKRVIGMTPREFRLGSL